MDEIKQVLIVCSGNICRSPMAVGLLKQLLEDDGLPGQIEVSSAGTYALVGEHPSRYATDAMAQRGIDISGHCARQLERQDIEAVDLVLVMEERHRTAAVGLTGPAALFKTLLLAELVGECDDVVDPYGQPAEEYERCAERLDHYLSEGYDGILKRLRLADSAR